MPAYLNWNAGVSSTRKIFHLDLRYYDTNLSKETASSSPAIPMPPPGGAIDPLTNPDKITRS